MQNLAIENCLNVKLGEETCYKKGSNHQGRKRRQEKPHLQKEFTISNQLGSLPRNLELKISDFCPNICLFHLHRENINMETGDNPFMLLGKLKKKQDDNHENGKLSGKK